MPVTRIKVTFKNVYVNDSADMFGPGEWYLTAKVDGKPVGDPGQEWEARDRDFIFLPEDAWSTEVDLKGRKPGDTVEITMSGRDADLLGSDELGEAKLTLKYPFANEYDTPIVSSVVKGWLFFPDHQYFAVHVKVEILEFLATTTADPDTGVLASRTADGGSSFSTLSGNAVTPRVEVCPVVPVPVSPSCLPPRPVLDASLTPGKATVWAAPADIQPGDALNSLANPSVIPVLSATAPDLQNEAARLAVTWYWPGDLDLSYLTWHVKEGPAEIVGSNKGESVLVRGKDTAQDTMAVFEVRWNGAKGPLLATYRAWVGKVKQLPYRINLVTGVNPAKQPERSPSLSTADVDGHVQIARVIWWQAGIELVPDSDATAWDGAVAATSEKAVFTVRAKEDGWTNNVNLNSSPHATRLNFNPAGVIHAVYVTSTKQRCAAATDLRGVDGKDYTLGGEPSTSWVQPSGIVPDKAGKDQKMGTFKDRGRTNWMDAQYATARKKVQPGFSKDDFKKLYALTYPADWGLGLNNNVHMRWGQNLAHEIGHLLSLYHRGSGGHTGVNQGVLSDDGIDGPDDHNKKRGHPWDENVMGYEPSRGLDVDLIQVMAVRRHPALKDRT